MLPNPRERDRPRTASSASTCVYGCRCWAASGRARAGRVAGAAPRAGATAQFAVRHGVDRIEALGRDALIVGAGARALGFTAIDLRTPEARRRRFLRHARRARGRSAQPRLLLQSRSVDADGASGMLGLPIARPVDGRYYRFFAGAAAMLFLSRRAAAVRPGRRARRRGRGVVDDDCVASCVDWYGNARPIFLRGPHLRLARLRAGRRAARAKAGDIRETGRLDGRRSRRRATAPAEGRRGTHRAPPALVTQRIRGSFMSIRSSSSRMLR